VRMTMVIPNPRPWPNPNLSDVLESAAGRAQHRAGEWHAHSQHRCCASAGPRG
jgi:hypothetical protein